MTQEQREAMWALKRSIEIRKNVDIDESRLANYIEQAPIKDGKKQLNYWEILKFATTK